MFDLIGDIHGHADELMSLLGKLGYHERQGCFHHPKRRVIFLGDFIDRGPSILRVLEIARSMVEAGSALAVMGNHEFNALGYHTKASPDSAQYLRPRIPKNVAQHAATLAQVPEGKLGEYLDWFRTLPLWLDLEGLRAVHACWDPPAQALIAAALAEHGGMTKSFLQAAFSKGQPLFKAVETTLKGKEARLPEGQFHVDKEGCKRYEIRTRWFLPATGHTFGSYALQTDPIECDLPLGSDAIAQALPYSTDEKAVFVGHYWLSPKDTPRPLADNVACLDFSVAKDGFLCAYRWNGEKKLDSRSFLTARNGEGNL